MQMLRGTRSQRLDTLISALIVLSVLLIVLGTFVLIGDILGILGRFRQQIFMFVAGAILAYVLAPVAHLVKRVVRKQWVAVAASYILLFLALSILGVLLINPFIAQARSLRSNLQNPAAGSLQNLHTVQKSASRLQSELIDQKNLVVAGLSLSPIQEQKALRDIASLKQQVAVLSSSQQLHGQIRIPPSYITPISTPLNRLAVEYGPEANLGHAVTDAGQVASAANTSYQKAVSTPILLLSLQFVLDEHGINVDLRDKFGKALQELSNQVAGIVNNALGIALQAGNLLLNTVLILLISVYFLSDGRRLVQWLISLVPLDSRSQAEYFVTSLDHILGAYLRTQILLALLAGILDAAGALVFGVPYAIVIFFSSFLLSLVPVIGPVVLPIPPMLIALIFTPLPKPIFYLAWLLVGEQLVTNIIGPRLQGHNVGIHPLEAMAAALIGFPLAGFLGAFFAVPIVAFLHVVARSFAHARRAMPAQETASGTQEVGATAVAAESVAGPSKT